MIRQCFVDSRWHGRLSWYPVNHTGANPPNNSRTYTVAIIPARFASTRLPGRALVKIAGEPMVCWATDRALAARNVERVIVATDSEETLSAVTSRGIEVALTQRNHVSGTDRIAEVAGTSSVRRVNCND